MQPSTHDQAPADPASVEGQLIAYVRRLERNYYDWRAVHLHLSQLKARHRRPYQLRVAASEFDGLLRRFGGELFQLRNGDLVYVWHGGSPAEVDAVVLRLRYLFSDDPLVNTVEAEAGDEDELALGPCDDLPTPAKFCTWFELEREYSSFYLHIEDLVATIAQADGSEVQQTATRPLDPALLARIETSLASMDLAGLTRRQAVCAVLQQGGPKPLFAEMFIAIRELADVLVPGVDLAGDTWLFQRLAESLDRRLLTCLTRGELGEPQDAISINLRLATLLSPEFLNFDHDYRRPSASPVIIELQLIDIFAELGAYLFIREFVRERGYLICIDGLHYLHMPLIERKRLGADLVKFIWSPDLIDGLDPARVDELRTAIRRTGIDRVILCRCDTADAIRWGQSMGIRLFQGHYVDSRLRATRPRAIAAARQAIRGQSAG